MMIKIHKEGLWAQRQRPTTTHSPAFYTLLNDKNLWQSRTAGVNDDHILRLHRSCVSFYVFMWIWIAIAITLNSSFLFVNQPSLPLLMMLVVWCYWWYSAYIMIIKIYHMRDWIWMMVVLARLEFLIFPVLPLLPSIQQ